MRSLELLDVQVLVEPEKSNKGVDTTLIDELGSETGKFEFSL
jgi:hypothetical protein